MIEVDVKYDEGEEKLAKIILEELHMIHRKKFFFAHRAFKRQILLEED